MIPKWAGDAEATVGRTVVMHQMALAQIRLQTRARLGEMYAVMNQFVERETGYRFPNRKPLPAQAPSTPLR